MQSYPALRWLGAAYGLASVLAASVLVLLLGSAHSSFLWSTVGLAAFADLAILFSPVRPRRDGKLFLLSALAGGMFLGTVAVGFPASLGIWLWVGVSTAMATLGIALEALAPLRQDASRN
jgi:hypothetical protein